MSQIAGLTKSGGRNNEIITTSMTQQNDTLAKQTRNADASKAQKYSDFEPKQDKSNGINSKRALKGEDLLIALGCAENDGM